MKATLIGLSCLAYLFHVETCSLVFAEEPDELLIKELVAVVRDPRLDQKERVAAAQTLEQLGPKAAVAVPELTAQLLRLRGTELENLQIAVIEALGAIGSPAKAALPTLARNAGRSVELDLTIRRTRNRILNSSNADDIRRLLIELASADASLRLRAVKALSALGPNAAIAVPFLIQTLTDQDGDVRRASIAALQLIQPKQSLPKEVAQAYVLDLKSPNELVRLLAVKSLSRLGVNAQAAAPEIEKLLTDSDPDVRKAATEALLKISGG